MLGTLGEQSSVFKMVQGIRKRVSLGDAVSRTAEATAWLQEELRVGKSYRPGSFAINAWVFKKRAISFHSHRLVKPAIYATSTLAKHNLSSFGLRDLLLLPIICST